ncbi:MULTISPECIES: 50S ribosomal protein L4 [Sphingomonas]|uniref:Large ribosomal subunit protein uL4 n=1 Tax=Sphingomonas citri TaxID=2862499 RepID=A0ABS7BKV1_9SPHN|nr:MULTISPECIES: 50S ribosomal protein L4 [Sphingomonas]MBY9063797.1 50S ribosomal protein L4 [Sphingomonas yunnanensis]MBB3346999.1 large subunit ribosomal protein L4 [Sphingomonas sp. BK069]MBB3471835.1 large subunit ribosomal protein L4 [Sphingomonas sp. BK345]MBB3691682.1 large subunit ribosomal protein L4 [Sphingomonas sp. BK580]MBW6530097.1 50S ribosomal protein L4 [Sphingomonas citri]
MKVKVSSFAGTDAADIELNDEVFGLDPRADILHRVVTWQLEKRRATARGTRERADVARSGKKLGRQKGGGVARHGDRRAPVFIGGGKAHGARVRDFNPGLNKKIRALGLKMALSSHAKAGSLIVLDAFEVQKTKELKGHFATLTTGKRTLVIDGEAGESFRAGRNLPGVDLLPAVGANVYDIIKADTLVLTRAAVEKLEARFNG